MECNLVESVNVIEMRFREGVLLSEVMQNKLYKLEEDCAIQGLNYRRACTCASLKKFEMLFNFRKVILLIDQVP
jgi:hypothetical protein